MAQGQRRSAGTTKDEAYAIGYSPRRRAVAYVLGDTMLRKKSPGYHALYEARKAYEMAREDEGKPQRLDRRPQARHAHHDEARAARSRICTGNELPFATTMPAT